MADVTQSEKIIHEAPNSTVKITKKAAHICLYTRGCAPGNSPDVVPKNYNELPIILLQLRFDGKIGFPGGIIEDEETAEQAAERELDEEFGCGKVMAKNKNPLELVVSHIMKSSTAEDTTWHLNFYCREVSREEISQIEQCAITALHYGSEVYGVLRIPLYINSRGEGFPTFLKYPFAGTARNQLVHFLLKKNIASREFLLQCCTISGFSLEALLE